MVCSVLIDSATGQPRGPVGPQPGEEPALIRSMAGTWSVRQRMWAGVDAPATDLPPAIARRRLLRGGFLEEVMELAPRASQEPFTRVAYFHFNAVTRRYEYVSLDSRAPQLMTEKSDAETGATAPNEAREIRLDGDVFLAPRWGDATNVRFRYRLTIGEIVRNRQVVRLYFTPQAGGGKEFLAFEYVYSRQTAPG